MFASPSRYFFLLLLGAAFALPLRSQEKPAAVKSKGDDKKTVPATPSKKTVDLKKLDLAALPADAVLILCERAGDAFNLFPKLVLLSPEKYQKMRDEIEELKGKLQNEKQMTTPTQCVLRGKVEGNAVRLEAEFSGTTERPNTLVSLGCTQAGASAVETEGVIRRSESSGFAVRIEKAGSYRVKLDLILSLAARESGGRGFEMTLPRPLITRLELDLPANVKDVRVGGRTLTNARLAGLELKNNRRLQGNPSLEPIEKLEVSWKEARKPMGQPTRTAEAAIQVRFDAAGLTTEADLLLAVGDAPTNEWRLLVPRKAEVKVSPPDDRRVQEIREEAKPPPFASAWTIRLKEASADPLHVHVRVPLLPHPGATMAVGPFFVLDAVRQTGSIVVRNQRRNVHLEYQGRGDMQLRRQQAAENGETPGTVATLVYSHIPKVENPKNATGSNSLSWLDLIAETVHPQVRTQVTHTLALQPSDNSGGRRWDIDTTIAPATKWNEGEPLKVVVPSKWQARDDSVSVIANVEPHYVLLSPPRDSSTQALRLPGRCETIYKTEDRAVLHLPRPQGTVESCEVKIEAPADTEILVHNGEQLHMTPSKTSRPNEQAWLCRGNVPEGVGIEVSWRPYRPELRVSSVVDLTLNGKHSDVRHEMRLQLPPTPPASLSLRVPEGIDEVRVESGEWRVERKKDTFFLSPLSTLPSALAKPLVLQYTTSLVEKTGGEWRVESGEKRQGSTLHPPLAVPLVTVEQATAGEVKVRIWSEPGVMPRPAASRQWEERRIEEVEGRRDLPVLVLQAMRRDAPLLLVLAEQTASYSVLVERSLLRVWLGEGGVQHWRARYQIRQLAERDLDIALPAPAATLNARFLLNGKQVTPELRDDKGEPTDGGNVARLRLSPRQSALLEVSFQSQPGRGERSPLHTVLQPPLLRGAPAVPARWLVSVPSNRVLLAPESAAGVERTWTRRDWLLAARLQPSNADLEGEFDRALPAELRRRHDSTESALDDERAPALVLWQDNAASLVVTQAPQQAWLLACSLALLLMGLGLYGAARPRVVEGGRMAVWFWPLLALLTLAVAVAALFWPTTLWAIAYGCEPGALVLLGVLALQWTVYQRYRRQIVFLPSFSRSRAGSSLVRKTAVPRVPSGEPSTVDAPPPSVG
jgi:hypothetical protein